MVRTDLMGAMLTHPLDTLRLDQTAFLEALLLQDADFVVVGGYAMRCLGHLRQTEDLDLVVEQSLDNASRVEAAWANLPSCNTGRIGLALLQPEKKFIWKGVEIFSAMKDLPYSALRADAQQCEWHGHRVNFMNSHWMQRAKRIALEAPDRQLKRGTDAEDLAFLLTQTPAN